MTHASPSRTWQIDPEIRLFADQIAASYAAFDLTPAATVEERRNQAEQVRAPWAKGGPVMEKTEEFQLPSTDVRIRIHYPSTAADQPALLYMHGGGWVLFSVDTHDRLLREYAARSGCVVVGLDYSRAPEARFPRPLDEVELCHDWLRSNASRLGIDPERIAFGGDSAGGNLALCSALRLRDKGGAMPKALLMNYAALDTTIRPSHNLFDGKPYTLGRDEMMVFWAEYLGKGETNNPYARPLLANLAGLPPCFICIAQCDVLADENEELAARLKRADVDVTAMTYAGTTHSFLEAVSISARADEALTDGAVWLRQILRSK